MSAHTLFVSNKRSVQAWPGMLRGVYGDRARYESTYFAPYPGYYYTGDGARRDADGYYWITGADIQSCASRTPPLVCAFCIFPPSCSVVFACWAERGRLQEMYVGGGLISCLPATQRPHRHDLNSAAHSAQYVSSLTIAA